MSNTSSSESLNLGLIGAGPWGRNYIKTIKGLKGITLSRLASRNPESARLVGPGCEIHQDWREMIKTNDLDGVIVATPPARHAEMTLAAVDRGLPVLVEKPLTLDVGEAEAVLDRARSKGAIVLVDHIHLYSAAWEALKREGVRLGPIRTIAAKAGRWGIFRPGTPVLWDWGSHYAAMCINLLGRVPENVRARRIESREVEDAKRKKKGEVLELDLDFGDAAASITIGNLFSEKIQLFSVAFDGGELIYDDCAKEKLILNPAPGYSGQPLALSGGLPLERAVLALAAAIALGSPDVDDLELGLDVVRTLARLEETLIPGE